MTSIKAIGILFLFLLILSCEETPPDPLGPCETSRWASATRNGEDDYCLGKVELFYWNANTKSANVALTAGTTEKVDIAEIGASFKVPVVGVDLNTPYPLIAGAIASADKFTEGSITFINFDYPGCVTGTFELKAVDSVSGVTQSYTNGKFVISTDETLDNACPNPFN